MGSGNLSHPHYKWVESTLVILCHLQPNAAKDEIAGVHNDRLKIRIASPPVEGKANTHLIKFLSKIFNVTKTDITIVKGLSSRYKTVHVRSPSQLPVDIVETE